MPPPSTAVKVPTGGVDWPRPWAPQQATAPLVLMPQVWLPPALIAVKVPAGGVDWPCELEPQQMRLPPWRTPQVWSSPAASAAPAKVPPGGLPSSCPQQTTVPSLFTAQMHVLRGLALAYAGNAREGMAESARGLDLGAPDPLATRSINYAYYTYVSARTALVAGDRDKAIELLGEAMRLRYFVTPAWLRIDPTWKSLRGDPRFEKLSTEP